MPNAPLDEVGGSDNQPEAILLLGGTVSTHLGRDELPVQLPGRTVALNRTALART